MYVSGANASQRYFAGAQNGTAVAISGSYSVTVYNQTGYTPTYSPGCTGTLNNGQVQSCYVTLAYDYNNNQSYPYYPQYPNYQYNTYPLHSGAVRAARRDLHGGLRADTPEHRLRADFPGDDLIRDRAHGSPWLAPHPLWQKDPCLLSSAKSGVLISTPPSSHWLRKAVIVLGVLAVVVGAADITARLSHAAFGDKSNLVAFAPAIAMPGSLAPLTPSRLLIPSLNIDAPVESVGKKADGSMDTPKKFGDVAWYNPGPKPGEAGNAVFAGHVNNALTTAGVFDHLSLIKPGATIEVRSAAGQTLSYIVETVTQYPVDEAPADEIFATTGPSKIALITCDGDWDAGAHEFDKRLVVVARLAGL